MAFRPWANNNLQERLDIDFEVVTKLHQYLGPPGAVVSSIKERAQPMELVLVTSRKSRAALPSTISGYVD